MAMSKTDSEYWLGKWQAGDIRFHRSAPHPALAQYFSSAPQGKVLVPLCGKSLDLIWLRSQGHQVIGVEMSSIACDAFFSENQLSVTQEPYKGFTIYKADQIRIWCGDFFRFPDEHLNDVTLIYDRAALIALPESMRKQYAQAICKWVQASNQADVQMLLVSVEYPDGTVAGPPFSVSEREISQLYSSTFNIENLYREKDAGLSENPRFKGIPAFESGFLLRKR